MFMFSQLIIIKAILRLSKLKNQEKEKIMMILSKLSQIKLLLKAHKAYMCIQIKICSA